MSSTIDPTSIGTLWIDHFDVSCLRTCPISQTKDKSHPQSSNSSLWLTHPAEPRITVLVLAAPYDPTPICLLNTSFNPTKIVSAHDTELLKSRTVRERAFCSASRPGVKETVQSVSRHCWDTLLITILRASSRFFLRSVLAQYASLLSEPAAAAAHTARIQHRVPEQRLRQHALPTNTSLRHATSFGSTGRDELRLQWSLHSSTNCCASSCSSPAELSVHSDEHASRQSIH